jgi:hypothetical protein
LARNSAITDWLKSCGGDMGVVYHADVVHRRVAFRSAGVHLP